VSKRRDVETQLRSLTEIKEIMNAMKNLSLMELHRLNRFLDTQRKVVASIETAAADFLLFHPELLAGEQPLRNVYLLVGSERGFCGDFNEALLRALDDYSGPAGDVTLVAIGSKLIAKLSADGRAAASLDGASVVEEVDSVLVKLMDTLTGLSEPGAAKAPLRLTVFHHNPNEERIRVSDLGSFHKPESKTIGFAHPPRLYLQPQTFFAGLADQYLFAALHELLYSSLMAENQRRMQHMDTAVRRLERKSTELLQKRNTLRQEEITEEIEVIMLSVEVPEWPRL
jgi:F-type H+-transporting ATPase subunit gamma